MNRRSFARLLGLAPIAAAALPLVGAQARSPSAGQIAAGAITAGSISATSLCAIDANLGETVAGRLACPRGKAVVDLSAGAIVFEV